MYELEITKAIPHCASALIKASLHIVEHRGHREGVLETLDHLHSRIVDVTLHGMIALVVHVSHRISAAYGGRKEIKGIYCSTSKRFGDVYENRRCLQS